MRVGCQRTKKLTIAFWFRRQAEPGWKCEECRALGLAKERNCGYLGLAPLENSPPVWAGGNTVLRECPKPIIGGESLALIEAYWIWCFQGRPWIRNQSARCLDAFLLLDGLVKQAAATQIPSHRNG
jgi:hypothetical protein